jgi:hypothetical protein
MGIIILAVIIVAVGFAFWRARNKRGTIARSGMAEIRAGEDRASIMLGEPSGRIERDMVGEPAPVEASEDAFRVERERREHHGRG